MDNNQQYWLDRVSRQGYRPSSNAPKEEKDAYEASIRMPLIESGELTPAALPQSYCGRPKGSSRRSMRMAYEWDKMQQESIQNQRLMQQMDIEQKEFAIRELENQGRMEDRDKERDIALAAAAREAKVKEQSRNIREAFLG